MKSIIDTINDNELQSIVLTHNSLRSILQSLQLSTNGSGCYAKLRNRIRTANIPTDHFILGRRDMGNIKSIDIKSIFTEHSQHSRTTIRKYILKCKLLPYKCNVCSITEWHGKKLSLQLDHINGNGLDHRLENLRFLCPNCHSLTETYGSKKLKKIWKCECGNEKVKQASHCRECKASSEKRFDPTINELYDLIHTQNMSYSAIGKIFGVSDNSIRKRAKQFNIHIKRK